VWVRRLWCVPFLVSISVGTSFPFPLPPTTISTLFLLSLISQGAFVVWLRKCSDCLSFTPPSTLSQPFHSFLKVKSPVLPRHLFLFNHPPLSHSFDIPPSASVLVQFLLRNSNHHAPLSLILLITTFHDNAFLHKLPFGHCRSC